MSSDNRPDPGMNMKNRQRVYEYDDWDRCELCEDFWCPRCDIHAADCPCMTVQTALDLGMTISDCGRWAVDG